MPEAITGGAQGSAQPLEVETGMELPENIPEVELAIETREAPHPDIQVEHFMVPASFAPSSINEEDRTIDAVWYTGIKVPRYDSRTDEEYDLILDMQGCRLGRLNNGAPVLDSHMAFGVESQMGVVQKAWAERSSGNATLRFSKRDAVTPVWNDVRSGIIQNLSPGMWIHKKVDTTPDGQRRKQYTATDWEPFEISLVAVPADANTTFMSAAGGPPPAKPTVVEAHRASAQRENPDMEQTTQAAGEDARQTEVALAAARDEATQTERVRVAEINRRATPFVATLGNAFPQPYIENGSTPDQFSAALLDGLAAIERTHRPEPRREDSGRLVSLTQDATDKRREAMCAALFHRHDGRTKLEGEARGYRGMSLLRLAEECLSNAGVKTRGMAPMELATVALTFGQQFVGVGADGIERLGAMSTSDFPYILANVANKTLRAAYEAQPSRWKEFSRRANARDFKAKYVNQLGDAPSLDLVPESGEFTTGSIPEAQESYRIYTYGKILPFTRQSLINDDMGAFTRLQELQGRSAARKEADLVWALITSNPTMGDGVALFHATAAPTGHGNLISGGTVINVDNLGIARQKMRIQKGLGKTEHLNLESRYLLVPTTKEQLAIQFTSVNYTPMATSTTASGINPWAGTLIPITEARLDANSATAWYMVADPAQTDTIEYAYLEGQEGVYLESRMGFNVDGMEFKCRIDFGAKVIDWRSFVKNNGA